MSLLGRVDPVVSVSGQLVSLTEVREALLEHPFVEDADVVELPDAVAGRALSACVVLSVREGAGESLAGDLRTHVRERLGGLAQPRTIAFVEALPEGVPPDLRRHALRLLCAADRSPTLLISAESLRGAVATAVASDDRA
jgi:acetyl-CoA synthetase